MSWQPQGWYKLQKGELTGASIKGFMQKELGWVEFKGDKDIVNIKFRKYICIGEGRERERS